MNDLKLYKIPQEISEILNSSVDEETGEVSVDAIARVDALQMVAKEKAVHIAVFIKQHFAGEEMLKNEEKRLKEKREWVAKRREHWENYLQDNREAYLGPGKKKFEHVKCTIKFTESTRCIQTEKKLSNIPDEYVKVEVKKSFDLAKAKKDIKDGKKLKDGKEIKFAENKTFTNIKVS